MRCVSVAYWLVALSYLGQAAAWNIWTDLAAHFLRNAAIVIVWQGP